MPDITLKQIAERVQTAIMQRNRDEWYEKARRMRDLYKGDMWPSSGISIDPSTAEHRVTINLAQVNIDIMVAAISYSDAEFQVIPLEPRAVQNAEYQKQALTKVWNEINALHVQRRRLKDAMIYGLGVNFVGWRYEEEDSAPQEGVPRPDYLPEGELPTLVLPGGELVAPPPEPEPPSIRVVYDNPVIRRVAPYRFFVDPAHDDLDDLTDAQYVIEEKILPERVVKTNPNYKNTSKIVGDTLEAVDKEERRKRNIRSEERYVKVYEYWQRDGRRHIVFADGQWDKPLLDERWPYQFDTYPYTTLVFRDIPDEQLPQGAIEPAETGAKLYNLYRTMQINHDEQMSRCPLGYDASKLSEEGKKALKSDKTGVLVECAGAPLEVIQPIAMPALPQDFYLTQAAIKDDVGITMAVNDYMQGQPDRTRRTLGEVQFTVALSAARGQLNQRKYEQACEKDARLILQLLQDQRFCDRRRWMTMTGQQKDQLMEINWNFETIAGRSDVRVVCNSTRVQTPESIQNVMGFVLQSLAPYVASGMVNIAPFVRKLGQSLNLTPQELDTVMQPMNQGLPNQDIGAVVAAVGQAIAQLSARVDELAQRIDAGAVDAKTQAEIARAEQRHAVDLQAAVQKHAIKLEHTRQKAAFDIGKRIGQEVAALGEEVV